MSRVPENHFNVVLDQKVKNAILTVVSRRGHFHTFVLSLFIFKVHRLLRARTLNPLTDPKGRPAPVCPVWVTMIIGPLSTQPRPPTVQF